MNQLYSQKFLRQFFKPRSGQSMVEYGLPIALVAVAAIVIAANSNVMDNMAQWMANAQGDGAVAGEKLVVKSMAADAAGGAGTGAGIALSGPSGSGGYNNSPGSSGGTLSPYLQLIQSLDSTNTSGNPGGGLIGVQGTISQAFYEAAAACACPDQPWVQAGYALAGTEGSLANASMETGGIADFTFSDLMGDGANTLGSQQDSFVIAVLNSHPRPTGDQFVNIMMAAANSENLAHIIGLGSLTEIGEVSDAVSEETINKFLEDRDTTIDNITTQSIIADTLASLFPDVTFEPDDIQALIDGKSLEDLLADMGAELDDALAATSGTDIGNGQCKNVTNCTNYRRSEQNSLATALNEMAAEKAEADEEAEEILNGPGGTQSGLDEDRNSSSPIPDIPINLN